MNQRFLHPKSSWIDVMREVADIHPNDCALSFSDANDLQHDLTYDQLDKAARSIAALMAHKGISHGRRAILLYPPGIDYVCALMGCFYAGVVAVPAYAPRNNASMLRLEAIFRSADAQILLSTRSLLESFRENPIAQQVLDRVEWMPTDDIDSSLFEEWLPPGISLDSLSILQFTSGSTGNPKGVMLTHRNLLQNSSVIQREMSCSRDAVSVMWLPPYHDMGLIGALLQAFYSRFPVHLISPAAFLQRPMRWLEMMSAKKGTIGVAPNFAYDLCVRRASQRAIEDLDLSRWVVAGNGAEPVRAETMRQFARTFSPCGFSERAFFPCYGLAEATLYVSGGGVGKGFVSVHADRQALMDRRLEVCEPLTPPGPPRGDIAQTVELVSSGAVAKEFNVMAVDPDTGLPCAEGCIGEIWVQGESVAAGYWMEPQGTSEVFRAALAAHAEPHAWASGAWLRTGDLGVLRDGQLFVTGRLKDLIIIAGQNHHPHDIESTVLAAVAHMGIHQVAAFNGSESGADQLVLVAELVGKRASESLALCSRMIRDAVSRHHQLHAGHLAFIPRNTLPRTSSGKLQRFLVRDRWLSGGLPIIAEEPHDTVVGAGVQ